MANVIGTDPKASILNISPTEDIKTALPKLIRNQIILWNRQNKLENRILELEKRS